MAIGQCPHDAELRLKSVLHCLPTAGTRVVLQKDRTRQTGAFHEALLWKEVSSSPREGKSLPAVGVGKPLLIAREAKMTLVAGRVYRDLLHPTVHHREQVSHNTFQFFN